MNECIQLGTNNMYISFCDKKIWGFKMYRKIMDNAKETEIKKFQITFGILEVH